MAFLVVPFLSLPCAAGASAAVRAPPMGWSSWNYMGTGPSAGLLLDTADAFTSTGLLEVGYKYIIATGTLQLYVAACISLVPLLLQSDALTRTLIPHFASFLLLIQTFNLTPNAQQRDGTNRIGLAMHRWSQRPPLPTAQYLPWLTSSTQRALNSASTVQQRSLRVHIEPAACITKGRTLSGTRLALSRSRSLSRARSLSRFRSRARALSPICLSCLARVRCLTWGLFGMLLLTYIPDMNAPV